MRKHILTALFAGIIIFLPKFVSAATFSLSPISGSYSVGQIFTVNILIDTQGQSIDGVDIRYLNYSPSQLEVQDDNAAQIGIQITAGNLMPLTQANSVNNTTGKITFSQITAGGTTFKSSGAQILATIHFKVLKAENTTVSFDYVSGRTSDCNIASNGVDILTGVTNGAYGPTAQPPSAPYCGDGACNGSETCSTCSSDCGKCSGGGTTTTPPGDTQPKPPPKTITTIPTKPLPANKPYCGDKICNGTETCSTCSSDCGKCSNRGTTPGASQPAAPSSTNPAAQAETSTAPATPAATTMPLSKTGYSSTTLLLTIFIILIVITALFILLRKILRSL